MPVRQNLLVPKLPSLKRTAVLAQFLSFAAVGLSNTALTFAVYTVLLKALDLDYLVAAAIGFACGAVNGYLLNGRITFRGHRGGPLAPLRWAVVQGFGLGLNEALVYASVDGLHASKLAGQAVAVLFVVVVTFVINRSWTFRMAAARQAL